MLTKQTLTLRRAIRLEKSSLVKLLVQPFCLWFHATGCLFLSLQILLPLPQKFSQLSICDSFQKQSHLPTQGKHHYRAVHLSHSTLICGRYSLQHQKGIKKKRQRRWLESKKTWSLKAAKFLPKTVQGKMYRQGFDPLLLGRF